MHAPHCDHCGTTMTRASRASTFEYKGKSVSFEQPGWYCPVDAAHEPVLDEADARATEPIVFAFRAEVETSAGISEELA